MIWIDSASPLFLPLLLIVLRSATTATLAWTLPSTTGSTFISTGRSDVRRHSMVSSNTEQEDVLAAKPNEHVKRLPNLPLPPPICSDIVGTWAYDTMSRRICQEILCNIVLKDCADDLSTVPFLSIRDSIIQLRTELQFAATTPLTPIVPSVLKTNEDDDDDDDDTTTSATEQQQQHMEECHEWNAILQPYLERNDTWLSAPWMITEFYLYRRLMQSWDYWNPPSVGYRYDPFYIQKRNGVLVSTGNAEPALTKLQNLIQQLHESNAGDDALLETGFRFALQLSLWGNKMDLSLWPADITAANTDVFSSILEQASSNLLHDDTTALYHDAVRELRTSADRPIHMDIIVDNAGFELVTDLALAQYLIESKMADTVTFQMKSHPTFVSDALTKDLMETIEHYENLDPIQYPACVRSGRQWRTYIENQQWVCHEDRFWVQPLAMWDMYPKLYRELQSRCHLAFVKGDANYRRLLGDRTWDLAAPFDQVVGCYFPVPVCALRTLKAEIGCGMDPSQTQRAAALDDNWMTNGRFGVIHYGKGSKYGTLEKK